MLDMLDHLGMNAIMVECDVHDPKPEALKQAFLQKPTAFVFQPKAHLHTGAMNHERLTKLAVLLAGHDNVLILE
ncbi:MAG: hypothetical protein ACSLEN_01050 [Candidatus Malihini olakiniferum]